ncbi:fibronectin type III domain-containing protein, partial [candidate division WOR-3 bacterium]|nr:fibronectin type III domain-containing protein [candidate division WOR-3 bacterium]
MGIVLISLLVVAIQPPGTPLVQDVPNDAGGNLEISWQPSLDDAQCSAYDVQRSADGVSFETIGVVPSGMTQYIDRNAAPGIEYQYQIVAVGHDGTTAASTVSDPCASRGQWFHAGKLNILIGFLIYAIILLYFIYQTRIGKKMYIRPIAGLEALDEAVGRATEMGKPILYV